jgi:uncharacterized protein YbdZ (MbtH family)
MAETEDDRRYEVVVNHEEQYSIWLADRELPPGWTPEGQQGSKQECLDHIDRVWTDMRPLSLRRAMEEAARNPPAPVADPPLAAPEVDLVTRLCNGDHAVALGLRPEPTVEALQACIERDYVYVVFVDTAGGTELGFKLDRERCELDADFANGHGRVRLVGELVLDDARVRCTADIELESLSGRGHLEPLDP